MKLLLLFLSLSISGISQELDTVSMYFDFDKSDPKPDFSGYMATFFTPFDFNSRIVRIESHCDTTGSLAYNQQLAESRMNKAKEQLLRENYSLENTEFIAFGKAKSATSNWTPEHSRRVDIIYIQPNYGTGTSRIESRNQVKQESPPEPIIQTIDSTQSFSTNAVQAFIDDSSATELKLDMTILFFNASDRVLPESEPELKELLKVLKAHPELNAEVHGHVCCSYNQEISEARARAVCMYLIDNKISNKRLKYEGHSNTQPKVWPEITEDDQKMNRRVSIVFKK